MSNKNPIGLFDSGIGGTSIWKEIHALLPFENSVYLADSINAPYGLRSKEDILELCVKNTEYLLNKNCKIIVVACNTATTNAISELRAKYDVPFIGIEPAIKPAVNLTKTQTIGVLATKGTLNSKLFHESISKYTSVNIIEQIGHGLVQLIESGDIDSDEMTVLLKSYVKPMLEQNIDYLVLGCSHYPYLIPQLKKIVPKNVKIIDSGEAVAKQTENILAKKGMLNDSRLKSKQLFYTNSDPEVLKKILGISKNVYKENF